MDLERLLGLWIEYRGKVALAKRDALPLKPYFLRRRTDASAAIRRNHE